MERVEVPGFRDVRLRCLSRPSLDNRNADRHCLSRPGAVSLEVEDRMDSPIDIFTRIKRFVYRDPKNLPAVPRYAVRSIQFLLSAWSEFTRNHGLIRASGLAYSTLLALVPLVVVVFSLFSAFGGLAAFRDQIQRAIVNLLVPTRHDEIISYLNRFQENARTLGIVGFVSFGLTSVFLLSTIRKNFNEIWGVQAEHGVMKSIGTYTSVLVLGTLLIGASFALSTWINSRLGEIEIRQITAAVQFFVRLFPTVFMLVAFLLMITQVPAERVQFSSALLGAAVGAGLWEAAKAFFAFWVETSTRNSVIYGSLALIPIVLLWLYVGWNIVLFALEVSYVHQHIQRSTAENYVPVTCHSERLLLGLGLFMNIAKSFHEGRETATLAELSNRFLVSPSEIDSIMRRFAAHRLVIPTGGQKAGYVPARSLESIRLAEIVQVLSGGVSARLEERFTEDPEAIRLACGIVNAGNAVMDGLTVHDAITGHSTDYIDLGGAEYRDAGCAETEPPGRESGPAGHGDTAGQSSRQGGDARSPVDAGREGG